MTHKPLVWLLLLVTAGCAVTTSGEQAQILVTFPQHDGPGLTYAGSQRSYHRGMDWTVSLHTRQTVRRVAREYDLAHVEGWPVESLALYCVAFQVPADINIDDLIASLSRDPRVAGAQANHQFKGMTRSEWRYNDPLFDLQYGRFRGAVEQLHRVSRGDNVRVGVIDSNVDDTHPDLSGRIRQQVAYTESADTLSMQHGTAVTGIIGATAGNGEGVVGLAPAADIHVFGACNKLGEETVCDSFALAKSIEEAMQSQVDVLNVSLAGPRDRLLDDLLSEALGRNILVIAAANPADAQANFPAAKTGVIAANGQADLWFAREEQMSTQAGGGYRVFYGTSVSAAALSGMAALLRTQAPAPEVQRMLETLATSRCMPPIQPGKIDRTEINVESICN